MKVPNLIAAIIPRAKITNYLLSTTHRDGAGKAKFFLGGGFSIKRWVKLRDALLEHAATYEVARIEDSPFGVRYVVEGIMQMPDQRQAMIRSVWFIRTGESWPHFVTAYPLKIR